VREIVTTKVHTLDDGAWISVDNERRLSVSGLWRLARHDFCPCEEADVLVEAFREVGVSHPDIEARIVGECIRCGTDGITDWVTVGRVVDDDFYPVVPESVHLPGRSVVRSRSRPR
jgi:hypothetical protein